MTQKNYYFLWLKEIFLCAVICGLVLWVNRAVLSLDLMYTEQPLMYLANQSIHSVRDLFAIYGHPKLLHIFSIPFFRPSGHFLIYQLLTPWLGWHNTQALLVVNLLFLGFTGYLTVKLYALLFPGYKVGGFIAFSVYLMHPALILSRLIVLHFEFAYVFLAVLSLYCFVRFCGNLRNGFLAAALFFYLFALTFKEPALMLGPVLAYYWCLSHYHSQKLGAYGRALFCNKQSLQVLCLLTILSAAGALYLTLPWPSLTNPLGEVISGNERMAAAGEFFKMIVGLPEHFFSHAFLYKAQLLWRNIVFPQTTSWILWALFLILLFSLMAIVFSVKAVSVYRKSLAFLGVSALLFLILPITWAMGLPWHLSLTLWCLSMMLGFGADDALQAVLTNKKIAQGCGWALALVIGFTTLEVNQANLNQLLAEQAYAMAVSRNAMHHPPDLDGKLDDNSVVVVEDSILHDSYALGNSGTTFFSLGDFDYDSFTKLQSLSFIKYQTLYNGNLFKWAYSRPALQEEVYSFEIAQMQKVPDIILYNWLQHYDNIFCLGYDSHAQWHDRTPAFKKRLLREKADRLLALHGYQLQAATSLQGKVLYTQKLVFPDYQLCQYQCDQNRECQGFTYESANYQQHSTLKCQFYESISRDDPKFCATCIGFVKEAPHPRLG